LCEREWVDGCCVSVRMKVGVRLGQHDSFYPMGRPLGPKLQGSPLTLGQKRNGALHYFYSNIKYNNELYY